MIKQKGLLNQNWKTYTECTLKCLLKSAQTAVTVSARLFGANGHLSLQKIKILKKPGQDAQNFFDFRGLVCTISPVVTNRKQYKNWQS